MRVRLRLRLRLRLRDYTPARAPLCAMHILHALGTGG